MLQDHVDRMSVLENRTQTGQTTGEQATTHGFSLWGLAPHVSWTSRASAAHCITQPHSYQHVEHCVIETLVRGILFIQLCQVLKL